jgi:hypothetical protein
VLEYWNNGAIGSGIMQCWINGKICGDDKIKPHQQQLIIDFL